MWTNRDAWLNGVVYAGLLGMATWQLAFNLYWTGVELLGRVGLWPQAWVWFDLNAFLAAGSWVNLLIFLTFVVLFGLAYVLLWARSRHALPVMLAAIVVGRADWIMLALNMYLPGSWMAVAEFGTQLTMLALCWLLRSRGVLR